MSKLRNGIGRSVHGGYLWALCVIVIFVFAVGFLWNAWVAEKEHVARELDTALRFSAEFCDGYFQRVESVNRLVGQEFVEHGDLLTPELATGILNNYKSINHDQRRFTLLTPQGRIFADTDTDVDPRRPYYVSEVPQNRVFDQGKVEERIQFSQVKPEESRSELVLPLKFVIRDHDGVLKYVLLSQLRLGLLQKFWRAALVPQQSTFGFVHNNGFLISQYAANPSENVGTGRSELFISALLAPVGPNGSFDVPASADTPKQLVVYRRLVYHPVVMFISIPFDYIRMAWWRRVKIPLLLGGVLALVLGAFYRLQVKHQRSERRFLRKQNQLQGITQGVFEAQEQERARISYELHDEIGQSLTALKITLKRAAQMAAEGLQLLPLLENGQKMVELMMVDVRQIAYRLRPSELDQLGLAAALRSHLNKVIRPLFENIVFVENIANRRFSEAIELCCFRVVQEALTNCLRYANAQEICVTLSFNAPVLQLSIADNGIGFDIARNYGATSRGNALGIAGMRERVLANGGRFSIKTKENQGTSIVVAFIIQDESDV